MGYYIVETLLEETCTNAELISLSDYDFSDLVVEDAKIIGTRNPNTNELVETTSFDRLINIYGLSLLTNIKEIKEINKRKKAKEDALNLTL